MITACPAQQYTISCLQPVQKLQLKKRKTESGRSIKESLLGAIKTSSTLIQILNISVRATIIKQQLVLAAFIQVEASVLY